MTDSNRSTDPVSLPMDVKRKLLAARDALAVGDLMEAHHQIYSIASPHFNKLADEVWTALETPTPDSPGGASGCACKGHPFNCYGHPHKCGCHATEPTETLYTAKDVEALFAIRDAAVAAHAAKPVATAWMRDGVIENAFPRPPRSAEEWAKYDADGYWKAKGYSEAPLYSAPPSPPEPGAGQWISVTDRLPPVQRMVILATPTSHRGRVDYGFLDMAGVFNVQTMIGWDDVRNYGTTVTHWMPMPSPPETKDEKHD